MGNRVLPITPTPGIPDEFIQKVNSRFRSLEMATTTAAPPHTAASVPGGGGSGGAGEYQLEVLE